MELIMKQLTIILTICLAFIGCTSNYRVKTYKDYNNDNPRIDASISTDRVFIGIQFYNGLSDSTRYTNSPYFFFNTDDKYTIPKIKSIKTTYFSPNMKEFTVNQNSYEYVDIRSQNTSIKKYEVLLNQRKYEFDPSLDPAESYNENIKEKIYDFSLHYECESDYFIKYDYFYVQWDICIDEKGVLKNYQYIGKLKNVKKKVRK